MKKQNPQILQSQIRTAVDIWKNIEHSPQPSDRVLGNYFHRYRRVLGSRDRRFLSTVIYALFRHRTFLETWCQSLKKNRDMRVLVLLAAVKENVISDAEAREAAKRFFPEGQDIPEIISLVGQGEFPPGIRFSNAVDEMALKFSFPKWLITRWSESLGRDRTRQLLEVFQSRPPLVVRANALKTTRETLVKKFQAHGFRVRETAFSPHGILFEEFANLFELEEFKQGFFEVQDEASQLIALAMEAKPHERVWDVCAGGGGKSLCLAAAMENKGRIVATDIRKGKLQDLKKRAKRAGAFVIFPADIERMSQMAIVRKGGFDKILVDAPCSGTGTYARNPDAKWKLTETLFKKHQKDQVQIIESSLKYLRKNGTLFYATCSIDHEENEEVMRKILAGHPNLKTVPVQGFRKAGERTSEGWMRLWPRQGCHDGFFLAGIMKL